MVALTAKSHGLIIEDRYRVILGSPTRKSTSDFIDAIAKEVEKKPKSVQKRFFKILRNSYLLVIPLLTTQKAHAAGATNIPLFDKAYSLDILPQEIVTILIQLIVAAGILGVAFAMLCLMVAGGYRMIGQTDKARNWSSDIIRGLGQILLAPVIILILVTLTSLIFRNVPGLDIFF